MTTPREDALALLRLDIAGLTELVFRDDTGTPSFPHRGSPAASAALDFIADIERQVAALGAEAETPDRMSPTVGGKYPERWKDAPQSRFGHCVDLASPETAEALARALHKAGIRCNPNIIYCGASHKGHAGRLLAAWRKDAER